ncbi:MAG: outer membrane beta-barrel protein [Chitinophagaceae bacterium]|nr:outer membrane beta-barrel protein [Chitinophagaceae bacterium]
MNEPLHDIDKIFTDGIEGYAEKPPVKIWDKIEAGLDKETVVAYKKKYYLLKRIAAGLLLLLLGSIIYELALRQQANENIAGPEKGTEQIEQVNGAGDDNETPPADDTNSLKEGTTLLPERDIKAYYNETNPLTLQEPEGTYGQKTRPEIETNYGKKDISIVKESSNKSGEKPKWLTSKNSRLDIEVMSPGVNSRNPSNDRQKNSGSAAMIDNSNMIAGAEVTMFKDFRMTPAGLLTKNVIETGNAGLKIPNDAEASVIVKIVWPKVKRSVDPAFASKGFSVSAYFMPGKAFNDIRNDRPHRSGPGGPGGGGGGGRIEDRKEIEKSESNDPTYTGGIKLSYGFSRRLSLQTGLNYTKSATVMTPKFIFTDRDNTGNLHYRLDCSSGYTYLKPGGSNPGSNDSSRVSNIRNTLTYIGVPLIAEYRISFGKFSLAASAGAQLNFLLKGKTTAVFNKGAVNEKAVSNDTRGLKPNYFSAIAGITGEFKVNKKLSILLSPAGQFGLEYINSGVSVKTRPNFAGLAAGLKLRL